MELHQIFLDMAVLVEAQGEMLDNIEAQVGPAPRLAQPAWRSPCAALQQQYACPCRAASAGETFAGLAR